MFPACVAADAPFIRDSATFCFAKVDYRPCRVQFFHSGLKPLKAGENFSTARIHAIVVSEVRRVFDFPDPGPARR